MTVESPAIDLEAVPGLLDALNSLTAGMNGLAYAPQRHRFDLARYQRQIEAYLRPFPLEFDRIPPLDENGRLDRIWRFIAVIFMAHAGLLNVVQHGQTLVVIKRETDREGQELSGELEKTDGVEGSVGGIEAW